MEIIINRLTGATMQGYKTGATQQNINVIKKLNEEGRPVEEIARVVLVDPVCVQKFVDHFNGEKKPKKAQSTKSAKAPKAAEKPAVKEPVEPDEPLEELPSVVGQSEV